MVFVCGFSFLSYPRGMDSASLGIPLHMMVLIEQVEINFKRGMHRPGGSPKEKA